MPLTAIHTAALLTLLLAVDPEPRPIGFVLEVTGTWEAVAAEPWRIRDGDQLFPGTRIRPAASVAASPTDSITICLYDGQTKVYRDAVTLPKKRDPSKWNLMWSAVFGHYRHGYASAISRGEDGLLDGVLGLSGETVDLAPMFEDVVDGSYRVELRKAEKRESSSAQAINWTFAQAPLGSVSVAWSFKQPPRINTGSLKPGLYEATLFEKRNPDVEKTVGAPAWILVCGSPEATGNAKAYAEAVQLTESWNANGEDKVSPSAKRAFLRAYLVSLHETQHP